MIRSTCRRKSSRLAVRGYLPKPFLSQRRGLLLGVLLLQRFAGKLFLSMSAVLRGLFLLCFKGIHAVLDVLDTQHFQHSHPKGAQSAESLPQIPLQFL